MSLKPYKTLMKRGSFEFIVNKSRFIGHGVPVGTEAEALEALGDIRSRYADASHNCYAYIIGSNMGVMRYSDDGEPGGTAGRPIIEVMKARAVTDALVVVTRYFGGVLLGAGGLTRAYAQGASAALEAAGVGVMYPTARYMMDVDYPMLSRMEYHLKSQPVRLEEKAFSEIVTLTLTVKCEDEARFVEGIVAVSDGRVEPVKFEEMYLAWEEE